MKDINKPDNQWSKDDQSHRMLQKAFYCPFCKKDFKKLIDYSLYENLDSTIGPNTRRNGLIPMQCEDCQSKESV
jgi:hypothetical protein